MIWESSIHFGWLSWEVILGYMRRQTEKSRGESQKAVLYNSTYLCSCLSSYSHFFQRWTVFGTCKPDSGEGRYAFNFYDSSFTRFLYFETCQKYHFSNKTLAILLNNYMIDLKNSVHRTNLWFQVDFENKTKIQQINML